MKAVYVGELSFIFKGGCKHRAKFPFGCAGMKTKDVINGYHLDLF